MPQHRQYRGLKKLRFIGLVQSAQQASVHRVIARAFRPVAISWYNLTVTYAPKSIEYPNIYNDITTFPHPTASQEIATACGLAMTVVFGGHTQHTICPPT